MQAGALGHARAAANYERGVRAQPFIRPFEFSRLAAGLGVIRRSVPTKDFRFRQPSEHRPGGPETGPDLRNIDKAGGDAFYLSLPRMPKGPLFDKTPQGKSWAATYDEVERH